MECVRISDTVAIFAPFAISLNSSWFIHFYRSVYFELMKMCLLYYIYVLLFSPIDTISNV